MARGLAAALGLLMAANAVFMLAAPESWYQAVPGVTGTGPFNRHFIDDIGAAFLVVGAGFGWAAWRPTQGWPALVAGTAFLTIHALVHLAEVAAGHGIHALLRDLGDVYLPTLLALALSLWMKPTRKEPNDAEAILPRPHRRVREGMGL